MLRSLDDLERISKVDSGNMLGAVNMFPDFLFEVARVGDVPAKLSRSLDNIVLVGMGGSGSAADVLNDWLGPRLSIPVLVIRDSVLPKFAGRQTLVLAISYSGETLETLAVFRKAVRRGCALGGVASGGRLATICDSLRVPFLRVRQGMVPRAALSPMVGAGAVALESLGLVRNVRADLLKAGWELTRLCASLRAEVPGAKNVAKQVALKLNGKLPVVYCLQRMGSVAHRAKNQFAENSKLLAKYALLPEAGHNEVVAWQSRDSHAIPVLIRDTEESEQELAFVKAFKAALSSASGTRALEVRTRTFSTLGRLLGPILMIDYVSVYLALLRGVDPTPTAALQKYRQLLSSR